MIFRRVSEVRILWEPCIENCYLQLQVLNNIKVMPDVALSWAIYFTKDNMLYNEDESNVKNEECKNDSLIIAKSYERKIL